MSTRKFGSDYSTIQRRRIDALTASHIGTINKFIKIDKENELEKCLNLNKSLKHLKENYRFEK